jgi:hypothetical protein
MTDRNTFTLYRANDGKVVGQWQVAEGEPPADILGMPVETVVVVPIDLADQGWTISVCPECGAQEQPSPVPGLLAETVHAEGCSGPENVALEVVRKAVPEMPDRSAYQKRKLREVLHRAKEANGGE